MTFEEMERTMQFVVAQQAQFVSDLMEMRQAQETFQAQVRALTETVSTVVSVVAQLAEETAHRFAETDQRFAETDRRFTETDRRFAELAEAQKRTDERLNILIDVVERYFRGRNGGSAR